MASLRVDELYQYFNATSHAVALNEDDIDSARGYRPDLAQLSKDPVLNALTQLGVTRLGYDRAFISLIDDKSQYVVAEMTGSVSLFDTSRHDENNSICIGTQRLDLLAGICASTMPAFTSIREAAVPYIQTSNVFADSTKYVINDLALEPQFASRPYVVGYPYMRYYAEVPITSQAGFVLGTYAIIDNKPGNGFADKDYLIMHEISRAIMKYIESIKLREDYDRSKRLLSGIHSFIQDTPGFLEEGRNADETPRITPQKRRLPNDTSIPDFEDGLSPTALSGEGATLVEQQSSTTLQCGLAATDQRDQSVFIDFASKANTELAGVSAFERFVKPATEGGRDPQSSVSSAPNEELPVLGSNNTGKAFNLDTETHNCFARAASLLRDSLELDGVVFIDTNTNNMSSRTSISVDTSMKNQMAGLTTSSSTSKTDEINHSMASITQNWEANALCRRLGIAMRDVPALDAMSTAPYHYSLSQAVYKEVLRLSPNGAIVNCHDSGDVFQGTRALSGQSSGLDIVSRDIRQYFPSARSVVFVPLWNSYSGRWFAGCVAWSTDKKRVFQSNDISYLTAFGNSVMAEVARLELLATNKAKSDFVSCISHELRSPLHGILGSTELLKESALGSDDHQLAMMIGSCASILLETIDNILYYSKINSVSINQKHNISGNLGSTALTPLDRVSGAISIFNLGALVEETCHAILAGQNYVNRVSMSKPHPKERQSKSNGTNVPSPINSSEHDVLVILRMDYDAAQSICSRAAAWRRCLLNIIGNALKYTDSGYVEVVLQRKQVLRAPDSEPENSICLSVRDTGCGIGKSYLDTQLFQPFVQENIHASGTGLGLSIVKNLVDDLEGTVVVDSEVNNGTKVNIVVPATPLGGFNHLNEDCNTCYGLSICFLGFDADASAATPPANSTALNVKRNMVIRRALATCCEQWLHMRCSYAREVDGNPADIYVVMEDNISLIELLQNGPGLMFQPKSEAFYLILCTTRNSPSLRPVSTRRTAYLSQPFGPNQIASAIASLRSSGTEAGPADLDQPAPNGAIANVSTQPASTSFEEGSADDRVEPADAVQSNIRQPVLSKNLLLVDDNAINLKLLIRCVNQLGCRYVTASNGEEALEAFKDSATPFDYVFMDISMPIMDGYESTQAIRQYEAENDLAETPIIAMTGLGNENARNKAISCGMNIFWIKPVKMKMIRSLIDDGDASAET